MSIGNRGIILQKETNYCDSLDRPFQYSVYHKDLFKVFCYNMRQALRQIKIFEELLYEKEETKEI